MHLRLLKVLWFLSCQSLFSPTRLVNYFALIGDAHAKSWGDLAILSNNVFNEGEGNAFE